MSGMEYEGMIQLIPSNGLMVAQEPVSSWKPSNNHGKISYLQAAVSAWNKFKAGK